MQFWPDDGRTFGVVAAPTRLLAKVEETGLSLFYALSPVRYGVTSGKTRTSS